MIRDVRREEEGPREGYEGESDMRRKSDSKGCEE